MVQQGDRSTLLEQRLDSPQLLVEALTAACDPSLVHTADERAPRTEPP